MTEAQRLRARLDAEAASRREVEARVAEVAARIGKLEEALRGRGEQERAAVAGLEAALAQEAGARREVEERNDKFGEVLLSVLGLHQHLLQHYHPPSTAASALGSLRAAALRRSQHRPGGGAAVAPFLPAPHRRTYNLLATLSQAVRECRRRPQPEPRQVLDALYGLVLQDAALANPRAERSAFPTKAVSEPTAGATSKVRRRAPGGLGFGFGLSCSRVSTRLDGTDYYVRNQGSRVPAAASMSAGQLQEVIQRQEEELAELQARCVVDSSLCSTCIPCYD